MLNAKNSINCADSASVITKRLQELTNLQQKQTQQLKERQERERQAFNILDKLQPDRQVTIGDMEYSNCDKHSLGVSGVDIKMRPKEEATVVQKGNFSVKSSPPPKRAFLKRGEGLKQRFKIDPEALRLQNLPKYKYANAHANLSLKGKAPAVPKPVKKLDEIKPIEKPKEPVIAPPSPIDLAFQRIFFSAQNVYNSTPDVKSSTCSSTLAITTSRNDNVSGQHNDSSLGVQPLPKMTWHKVLDAQQLIPIRVGEMRGGHSGDDHDTDDGDEDCDNTDLFELLEKKALEGTIDMNSSCIKEFMKRRKVYKNTEDLDVIPVREQLKKSGLRPQVAEVIPDDDDSSVDDESSDSGADELVAEKPEISTSTVSEKSCLAQHRDRPANMHVRFSDQNSTLEYEYEEDSEEEEVEEAESTREQSSNAIVSAHNSTLQDLKKAVFDILAKQALESRRASTVSSIESSLQSSITSTTTAAPTSDESNFITGTPNFSTNGISADLVQQKKLLEERLNNLEREIAMFNQSKSDLMTTIQQHELAKAHFEQERLDAENRIKDEQLKIEMYIHDERMKIEKQRQEVNQKLRTVVALNKENKEAHRLKEELDAMVLVHKQKEQEHANAKARLRVQISNAEKDRKALQEDIERLTKENKRLQMQLAKLSRENNNKMLQEINRNISKLTPRMQPPAEPSDKSKKLSLPTKLPAKLTKKSPTSSSIKEPKRFLFDENELPVKTDRTGKDDKRKVDDGDGDGTDEEDIHLLLSPIIKENSVEKSFESAKNPSEISASSSMKNSNDNNNADTNDNNTITESKDHERDITNSDGSRDIWYKNGSLKKISADGMLVRTLYFNNDIKETDINEGTVKYYYAATNVWHTTYLDGLEILEFPSGQKEHRHKNGIVETHFPDNSVQKINPNDQYKKEEWTYADGTTMLVLRNDDRILTFPNGQKEIRTKSHKRREYPDGTVKIVYGDGSQETRYSNGRVRMKDKEGNLLMDTEQSQC